MKLSIKKPKNPHFPKKTALILLLTLSCHTAAIASSDTDRAWNDLVKKYSNPTTSKDLAVTSKPSGPEEITLQTLSSWWNLFGDDTLTQLIEYSLQNNRDLHAARAKVKEARAAVSSTKAINLPWFNGTSGWNNTQASDNSLTPLGHNDIYSLGIDATWEIDLFGGRRQDVKASVATLEAQYAALHSAWVSLSAEVALNYFSLRTLEERLTIAQSNLALQAETLKIQEARYKAGLIDSLGLSQAQYAVEETKASIPTIRSGIEGTKNALAILTGKIPGSLDQLLSQNKGLPDPMTFDLTGIPADAIRQRPDVKAAESSLSAQIARKKSAQKDLLPKLTLTGSIGLESLSSGSLFSSDSVLYSFGPRLTLPIFHGGAIRQNIKVQTAREEQLLAAYEQSVLKAVAEVRDALTSHTEEIIRNHSLKKGTQSAKNAVEASDHKYKHGLTDFYNVISSQRALLSLQDQYIISKGQMTANLIGIFKALGGGWAPLQEEYQEETQKTAVKN